MNEDNITISQSELTKLLGACDTTIKNSNSTLLCNETSISNSQGTNINETVSIKKGSTIFGLYTVKSRAICGGMGHVFRMYHKGWNVELAMKQPRTELFQNIKQKEGFVKECEHWIELGLHPHIVSCYYVREINGIPSIFSEWMEGGCLKDWIYPKRNEKNGQLYKGNEKKVLKRILDISIQFARGLHYAHEQGLIHQDVKPANVLLTIERKAKVLTAKVGDFGISGARVNIAKITNGTNLSNSNTIVVKGHAYTPAYCSPEQKAGAKLTRRSDIWSWAVSILEMFLGKLQWSYGSKVGSKCEDLFRKKMLTPMPKKVKELLRHCFKENEADRPHDFAVVEAELLKIYQAETGKTYPRPALKAASLTADSLNNKALSFLDLGKPEEAEKCWKQALDVMSNHAESLYNQSIHLWRNTKIDDIEALNRLSKHRTEATDYYLAKIHLSRGDAKNAIECLHKAKNILGETDDIKKAFDIALEMKKSTTSVRTFDNNNNSVYLFCFSPDGKSALSRGKDKTLKLWDVESGQCLQTFKGHQDDINSVCFSPDGKTVLSGSKDRTIKLWDVTTGKCLRVFKGHGSCINSVCFSPDGRRILSGSGREGKKITVTQGFTMKLWDIETGQCIHTFSGFKLFVRTVCFSLDGKTAISSSGANIKLWDVASGQLLHSFTFARDKSVYDVSFSPDRRMILACFNLGIDLWDIITGQYIRSYDYSWHNRYTVFSPDGKNALSNEGHFFDLATSQCLRTFEYGVRFASFGPDGKTAIYGVRDGALELWFFPDNPHYEMVQSKINTTEKTLQNTDLFDSLAVKTNTLLEKRDITRALTALSELAEKQIFGRSTTYQAIKKQIARYCVFDKINYITPINDSRNYTKSSRFSSDGKTAISIIGRNVYFWDAQSWQYIQDDMIFKESFYPASCLSQDGKTALSYYKKNYSKKSEHSYNKTDIKIWDVSTREHLRTLAEQEKEVKFACFNPIGKTVLASYDKILKLWDVDTGLCLWSLELENTFYSICFSPDGKTALSYSEKSLFLWDIENGVCLHTFEHEKQINSFCYSPNGKTALTINNYNTMKLWDINTRECLYTLEYEYFINSFCYSPNGENVATLNQKTETLKIWNIKTWECLHTFEECNLFEISPDGNTVLTVSYRNLVKLWNIKTGQCLFTIDWLNDDISGKSAFPFHIDSALFNQNGTHIILSRGGILYIDYDLHFPGWTDWDEGARQYLDIFLALHPNWTDDDFKNLITELQNRGYGWIEPEGVRVKLQELSNI